MISRILFTIHKIAVLPVILFFLLIPVLNIANASSGILGRLNKTVENVYNDENPETQLAEIVGLVVSMFFSLLGILFISMIIYAGYHWMTARGEQEKVKEAQTTIRAAIIGLIIIIAAYAIWDFLSYQLEIEQTST